MAHTKSALKRAKTSEKARIRNKSRKSEIFTTEKKFRAAVATDAAAAEQLLKEVYGQLDKAAKAGAIHRNQANRKKSRLAAVIAKAKAPKKA